MIFLSFNCRGLASQPKKLAFRELIRSKNPDVIMLQETLGKGDEAINILSKMLPGWVFHALDAVGRSGEVVSGYNSKKLRYIYSWGYSGTLFK